MANIFYEIINVVLFIAGVIIAYILGCTCKAHAIGQIVITDSDDPKLQGKVQFIFNEQIEDLILHKYVTLEVHNQLSVKYNHDNEETK